MSSRYYVRPIVRGKETKSVEFGAKVNNIQIDGISFIETSLSRHSMRAYVITVNTDNTVTDFPTFKEFLFLYKNLSDYGKPFLIILCICE